MEMELVVVKVGKGEIEDEQTKQLKPWAKLYGTSTDFVENDMFTGFSETEFAIVGDDGQPSHELAKQIAQAVLKQKGKFPIKIKFKMSMKIAQKKTVLSICGLVA